MKQSPLLEFESFLFSIEPGEDALTNPGVYGKALASWLATELSRRELHPGEIFAEDFGWCIPVGTKPRELYVACASNAEDMNGWRVFVFSERSFRQRLFGTVAGDDAIESLFKAIKLILQGATCVENLREFPV